MQTDTALRVVRQVLAADFACAPDDFTREGTVVLPWEDRPGRRRFPLHADRPRLGLATMGIGAVVSCSADRLDWAREQLSQLGRDDLFSLPVLTRIAALVRPAGQYLSGPNLLHVGSSETLRPTSVPAGITIELVEQDRLPSLYAHEGFRNALHYRFRAERPDVLAAVAIDAGRVVGIAGASADCDKLWQIGLDVRPEYRGRGIGKAVTARLAAAILARGKIPYYAAVPANLASRNVAVGVGFRPCWIEVAAYDESRLYPSRQSSNTPR
ncbi:MAG TPA: GNAT family N-acetyltransferase [Chloroflexota bacterium]|nr:GNAT family N-acetyltransferase [Chloroflexota bacterium]